MLNKKTFAAVMAICVCVMFLGGCASKTETNYSGFLKDYSRLDQGPKDGVKERYIKQGVEFGKYDKIMLDNVVFFLDEDAEYKGIDAEDMKVLSDSFNKAMVDALGTDYPLVAEPGPDVLRVRTAITNLKPSKPGASTLTTVVPVGLAVSLVKKGATGEYTGVGTTAMEVEFLDSTTNEMIGAAVDDHPGGKLSGFSKWSASEEAFKYWAKRLKAFLDNAHGKM